MATKTLAEDVDDVNKSLQFLSQEIIKVSEKQACLKELTDEIKQLKTLIQEKDKRIEYLEKRIHYLEQCSRM